MSNEYKTTEVYQSPAGGNNRSTSANGDSAILSEALLAAKAATQVGTPVFATATAPLDTADFPMHGGSSYQDAKLVFKNGRKSRTFEVKDMALAYKASTPPGTNNLDTGNGDIDDLIDAWIASSADHSGYSIYRAFFTRH